MSDALVTRTLTLDAAGRVLDAATARAGDLGIAVCVAVTGTDGELKAYARMDGAPALSGRIAQDKAYTVVAFNGMPTHQWWDLVKGDPSLIHGLVKTDRLVIVAGGVPVTVEDELAGAVGVSGGTVDEDRGIAETAARAI